jgi:hypothetical protein
MTPFIEWAQSNSSELRQLHSRATTPFTTTNAGAAIATFATLEEQLEQLFAANLSLHDAALIFAEVTDSRTQQRFAPELVHAYTAQLTRLEAPDDLAVKFVLKQPVWFVAALAQVHIMRTASSGLRGVLLGDMALEKEILRYGDNQ